MSCNCADPTCTTTQIIEPNNDLLVDIAGATSDLDEHGELALNPGQTSAVILFQVPKLNANYEFEYLYIEALSNPHPGAVVVIPTIKAFEGFGVAFAGAPIGTGYVLKWRVVIRLTTTLLLIDAPEDLYLPMPRSNLMAVTFHNPRSGVNYGFSELRVENLIDAPSSQAIIRVQVVQKTMSGFTMGVNPTPRTDNYFLKVRTP